MYFIYVDESGDTGFKAGASPIFVLSGMVIHELSWHSTLQCVIDFRRHLRGKYGLKLREEIHATDFINRPGALQRIPKSLRLRLLRDVLDFVESLQNVSLINLVCDKNGKNNGYDIFDNSWQALFQRFHNTISHKNFPGPQNPQDYGMVVADQTDEPKLKRLARKLRRYNPVPGRAGMPMRQMPLMTLVEDPVHRDSAHSYLLQLVDVTAYFLYQREAGGNKYIRKQGAINYFNRLNAVLCKVASQTDKQGVVRL